MATWKKDPSVRKGRKNSAESSTMENAVANDIAPCPYCTSAQPMPAAAPPKAIRSMTVMGIELHAQKAHGGPAKPFGLGIHGFMRALVGRKHLERGKALDVFQNVAPRSA